MPLFNLFCENCGFEEKRILVKYEPYECKECHSGSMKREPNFSLQVKEVLDNGFMPRKVERLRDAESLNKERKNQRVKDKKEIK